MRLSLVHMAALPNHDAPSHTPDSYELKMSADTLKPSITPDKDFRVQPLEAKGP